MKILLVKTSSMGDVVHTLTALREAKLQRPELHIDWLVEADFIEMAKLAKQHGDVHQIIPIQFRKWRKRKPFGVFFNPDIQQLKQSLQKEKYDLVIDAQGLLKSAFLCRLANAPIEGFDQYSAREGLATKAYTKTHLVKKDLHAIQRLRQLFACILGYELLEDNRLNINKYQQTNHNSIHNSAQDSVILFHGTTWDNKRYPTTLWNETALKLSKKGYTISIPHHGESEKKTAKKIAHSNDNANVLPEQMIQEFIPMLKKATGVISVDTGLAHLAIYLGIPTVILHGPTSPELTGGIGENCCNIVGKASDTQSLKREYYAEEEIFSESMQAISPQQVVDEFTRLVNKKKI